MKISRSALDPVLLSAAGIGLPLWAVYWLILHWSWPTLLTVIATSWILGANISMFAHRAWSHKSWKPSSAVNWVGMILFHLTMVGNSIGWVGIHREHHKFCDTDRDPHSPLHKSRWRIQFLSYFNRVKPQFILDLARDPHHQWFYRWYWLINFAWWTVLALISFELLALWLAVLGVTIFKLHTINSLCHATPKFLLPINNDHTSTNSVLMVLLNVNNGEAWHKNHHGNASAWSFRQRWYEIDPPAVVIWTLCRLGWAKV
jgi:fatty-acid desaturase